MSWTYVTRDHKGEEIVGTFHEKEFQKTNLKKFRVEKIIKTKGDKLCVNWNDNSFKFWIHKKYIIIGKELFSRTIYPQ